MTVVERAEGARIAAGGALDELGVGGLGGWRRPPIAGRPTPYGWTVALPGGASH